MSSRAPSSLSFAGFPPIYILPSHLTDDEIHEAEESLLHHQGPLTYNVGEARIFLGKISQRKRAAFDLRGRGLWTEDAQQERDQPPRKRNKLSSGSPNLKSAHSSGGSSRDSSPDKELLISNNFPLQIPTDRVIVLHLSWLRCSILAERLLPIEKYLVYSAKVILKPVEETSPRAVKDSVTYIKASQKSGDRSSTPTRPESGEGDDIISRAQIEASEAPRRSHPSLYAQRRRFNQSSSPALTHASGPPKLRRTTTSEFETENALSLPDPPDWVKSNNIYSCCRSTFPDPPNKGFLEQLHKIKEARLLTLDEIGVRAYSTSIAAISAYPFFLQSENEILRLPGCDQRIAALWAEWVESAEDVSSRHLRVVDALEKDEDLQHLKLFHEIWGVGPDTARKFYYDKGWKDIDDVIEYGWSTLNRVQQIGVKFYDEFQVKIPRPEVEEIAETIHRHARLCRSVTENDWNTDRDMVTVIVGGYRRGKSECGDVDVILSHRNEEMTKDLVVDVVSSLEQEGWITHTLTLNTTTSDRDQQTLPYRGVSHGHGFDSLDKALCVWQNPDYDQQKHEKNPNIHRRVDIIISTWRTVGCAVLGWSGATTFQRDIRRWVKREKGWKFDSSGIRDRATGHVLDLESPKRADDSDTWLDREKRLMNGLGIGWRPPRERCTG